MFCICLFCKTCNFHENLNDSRCDGFNDGFDDGFDDRSNGEVDDGRSDGFNDGFDMDLLLNVMWRELGSKGAWDGQ